MNTWKNVTADKIQLLSNLCLEAVNCILIDITEPLFMNIIQLHVNYVLHPVGRLGESRGDILKVNKMQMYFKMFLLVDSD